MHAHLADDSRTHRRGMTLVEIIAVLILLGSLTAVVVSIFPDMALRELYTRFDVVKDHIRYAQLMSMKQDDVYGVRCDGSSYWLFRATPPLDPLAAPNDAGNLRNFPNEGVGALDLSADDMGLTAFTVFFDTHGEPYSSFVDENDAANVELTTPLNLTMTHSGSADTLTITITPFTGFIP